MRARVKHTFWDCEQLSFRELPTVQDLFKAVDKDLLTKVIFDNHITKTDNYNLNNKKAAKKAKKLVRSTLDKMCQSKISKKTKYCIFAKKFLEREMDSYHVCRMSIFPECYHKKEFKKLVKPLDDDINNIYKDKPESVSLIFDDWSHVLSMKIWLKNCKSKQEKYLVLSEIFWEMTFFGFNQKEHDKNFKNQMKSIDADMKKELKKQKKMSQKEIDRKYSPTRIYRYYGYGVEKAPDTFDKEYGSSLNETLDTCNKTLTNEFYQMIADLNEILWK